MNIKNVTIYFKLWRKYMSYINTINNDNTNYLIAGVSNIIVCSTDASTEAKTATAMDGFSLDSNLSFKIMFTNGNIASSPTLNLNDTGAKSLTTTTSDYAFVPNMLYDCYYNGTSYVLDNTVTVHTADTSNPHNVTKAQVGLGNCDNTADADKDVNSARVASFATSANKLTRARTTYVTLGTASTTTTRDWSGTTTIPVSGTLPVANGGTGTTSLSNITVGNSSKLGGYGVQTSSIGESSTESTNYWTYVTNSKLTSNGGYIKYSNGLLIHYFCVPFPRIQTKVTFNPPFKTPNYTVVLAGTSAGTAYFYDKTSSSVYVNINDFQNEIDGIAIGLSA